MSTNRITTGKALAVFQDELLVSDGERILSYDESANGWTNKGPFISTYVTRNPVIHDTNTQSHPDCATHFSGAQAYVFEQGSDVRYSIIDGTTGQTVVYSTLLAANAVKPRVLVSGGTFIFYWYSTSTTQLFVSTLSVYAPHATMTATAITAAAASANGVNTTNPNYDAAIIPTISGEQVALTFNNGASGTTVRMYAVTNLTSASAQTTIATASRAITVFDALLSVSTPASRGPVVALVYFVTGSTFEVRYFAYDSLLTLVGSGATPVVSSATAGTYDGIMVTGTRVSDANLGFHLYYTHRQATGNGNVIESVISQSIVNSSYTVYSTEERWIASATLAAKAFTLGSLVYVPAMYDVNDTSAGYDQYGYFVVQADKTIVAKALADTAGSPPWKGFTSTSRSLLPSVNTLSGSAFRFAATEQANLNSVGLDTPDGIASLSFDFDEPPYSFNHAQLANNLHFSGGFVQMYDGVDVVEHGFHVYPELWDGCVTATGTAGALSAGLYGYCVTYEWVDHQNNVHRSRPSRVRSITVAATNTVTLKVPYLQLTDKRADRPVEIVVYRTLANGVVFYRASSLIASPSDLNVIGGANLSATITDGLSDANLAKRPLLYTQQVAGLSTGEPYEVPNDPGPPAAAVQLHRNRIWVLDSTNPLQLWYSKEVFAGAPVEFNNSFVKQIDPRGGDITALATIDDKLLVFKNSHIFFVVGQGPTNTNLNNDLSDAILITTDVGCIDPRSISATPIGLMFKSRKGIYLIDRGLQVQYIGAAVEAYNDQEITSATLVADTNQVRFTLGNQTALVFDYFVQQWGVFTNHNAVDAIIWNGQFVYLRPNGQVLVETPGQFSDVGAPYRLKLATSWLSFANVQGFQRVRRAQILGGWRSPHDLKVDVCVDFDDTVVQSVTAEPQAPSIYGVGTYGSETPYGGNFQLYQWRVDLARQKTQSVKFIIQDLPAATAGEGMSLTSLAFEVGAKVGLNKVPATQIVG